MLIFSLRGGGGAIFFFARIAYMNPAFGESKTHTIQIS